MHLQPLLNTYAPHTFTPPCEATPFHSSTLHTVSRAPKVQRRCNHYPMTEHRFTEKMQSLTLGAKVVIASSLHLMHLRCKGVLHRVEASKMQSLTYTPVPPGFARHFIHPCTLCISDVQAISFTLCLARIRKKVP